MSPPLARIASDERLPAAADVVVIGGGIIGVASAYALARKGISVAVLEKGAIGAEQSSRNWGWCRQQNRDERELPLARASLEIWGGLSAKTGLDFGFRRTGLVYVSDKQSDVANWEKFAATARQYQIVSRVLTGAEAATMLPGCAGQWIGGAHSPTDGRAEPAIATPRLAEAARARGVTLHQDCAARGLEMTAGHISGVVTERGTIRTQAVLCAGGAWASLFCRRHGIDLPQAGIRATSFFTTPGPAVMEGGLSTPHLTMRRRQDGGYTLGLSGRGMLEITPQGLRYARQFWPTFKARRRNVQMRLGASFLRGPEAIAHWRLDETSPFERIRTLDPAPQQSLIDEGMATMRRLYPTLADVTVAKSWGGLIDFTPDGIPVISPVAALPGLHIAAGFSGHGFGIGPAAGQLAADLITGDPPIVDPLPFRHARLVDGSEIGGPSALI